MITIIAYVKHSLENARLEKARLLSEFNSRVRRADYLLNDIPLQMLSNGLAVFLLEEKQQALECIKTLCGRKVPPDVLKGMEEVKQRLSVIQQEIANKQQEHFAITSEKRAKEIQSLLHELYRQVSDSYKSNRLNKADANKFSVLIKGLIVTTSVELLSSFAKEAEKQEKYRSAIRYYTQALDELKKHNQKQQYVEQIKQLQSLIRALEQKETDKASPAEDSGQLVDQLDELKSSDEDWKKKNVYD
ncbi:hypothetical protein H0A36_02075 [Endozoicomonas sp. SM1973]|uniref:Uncharacterized protein n=1 Tax=Spartinivicinus marinus TaxID=2994442 RepID=A0A853IBJ4_9GAMM|nr:hypothetical protein [Spartinivicinus marinus]MCX4029980.1 hypothetical protein [Spartinivicinus marinus]NYZ64776.1 hypothetical protein [Spartinivicinus marinus]